MTFSFPLSSSPSLLISSALLLLLPALAHLFRPPPNLLALAPPATLSRLPGIPSYVCLPFLPSPTLFKHWLALCWRLQIAPWRLRRQVINAVDVDWTDEAVDEKEGKLLKAWDRVGYWQKEDGCLELRALKKWEALADPLADTALRSILSQPANAESSTNDLLGRLQPSSDAPELSRFTSFATQRRPPRGAGVIPLEWYAKRDAQRGVQTPSWLAKEQHSAHEDLIPDEELEAGIEGEEACFQRLQTLTSWHDEEWKSLSEVETAEELAEEARLIKLGQKVFYRYSGGILMSLLHFSLAAGFASPRLTGVLKATNYLVPAERQGLDEERQEAIQRKEKSEKEKKKDAEEGEKTWRRLMETTQWVLDVMETVDTLTAPVEGKLSASNGTSSSPFGGPGREATLSVRMLHARVRTRVASKLSLPPSCLPLNQADLLATLLSFSAAPLVSLSRMGLTLAPEEREAYLGLWRYIGWLMGVDDRLVRSCLVDCSRADRALWSCVLNLFSEEEVARQAAPTLRILTSIAARPPFYTSLPLHVALSSSLLGKTLSTALRLPPSSPGMKLRVALTYAGTYLTTSFSKWYLPSTRGKVWEETRDRSSRKLLRRLIVWNLGMRRSHFHGGSEGVEGMEDVPKDEKAAMADVREYQWMIREMVAVHVLAGCTAVGAFGLGAWYLKSA